jgi:hypothetical protein
MGPDGTLRYHLGVEFNSPIALADPAPAIGPTAPAAVGPLAPTGGPRRNRW